MDTSYLEQQVSTIIGKLHELFDEIGVPSHERDTRESELFSALSETLHNQLRLVANEKHELAEEANRLITTIKQMEQSVNGPDANNRYHDDDLKVTYPLTRCLQHLKEKHSTVSKLHRERFEQVKKLVEALESYSSHLEPSFVKIQLPPIAPGTTISPAFDLSPDYVNKLDAEFTRVYDEYARRIDLVKALAEEIVMLWAELGTPQAQTDNAIVEFSRDSPEQLGLHQDDVARLRSRRDKLVQEKAGREKKLKELRSTIGDLWDRLGVEERDRKAFLASNRGCGLRTINEHEDELARLNELKRQNLHLFVEDARFKLQELWDSLYFSEEEMLDFTPAFSDVYSDALLSAHEAEITRLEALKEQRAPTLTMIDRHRELVKERDELAASSQDASRLMAKGQKGERRDPGKLLREEKMRKRIAKELPKVAAQLQKVLEQWEDEYGRPFLVHGERYLDELNASNVKAPPPRSKTPNALNPPTRPGTAMGRPAQAVRSATGSVRGPPPTRSKTPTAAYSSQTMPKSVLANTMRSGTRSPSKIPARVPLGSTNGNSPERRAPASAVGGHDTIRKMAPPPARAPPPKMKDLFAPPPPQAVHTTHDEYLERSASIVRHVAPEDPYHDGNERYFQGSRMGHRPTPSAPESLSGGAMRPPPHQGHSRYGSVAREHNVPEASMPESASMYSLHSRPESRVMSNTSSTSAHSLNTNPTTVSGSENWETYESESEAGDHHQYQYQRQHQYQQQQQQQQQQYQREQSLDASTGASGVDAYYAKLRASQRAGLGAQGVLGKRSNGVPGGPYASPRPGLGKKMRPESIVEVDGEPMPVRESEVSWEDEDAYC